MRRCRALAPLLIALAAFGCRAKSSAPAPAPGSSAPPPAAARSEPPSTLEPVAAPSAGPRLGALTSRVYVRQSPRPSSPEIGVLHVGEVVALRDEKPAGTDGCSKGWYPVAPEGYVCLDPSTTLDVDANPVLAAKRTHHGDFTSATPFRWSASREGMLYKRLPSSDEQRKTEFELARHLERVAALRAALDTGTSPPKVPQALVGVDVRRASGAVPPFLANGALSPWARAAMPDDKRARAKWIPTRSAVAWTDEFEAEGRSWVLTDDLLIAPKDKLVPLEPSSFEGVTIDDEQVRLPLAFIRREPRPKFRFSPQAEDLTPVEYEVEDDPDDTPPPPEEIDPLSAFREDTAAGELSETDETWPRLGHVGLTGRFRKQGRVRYLETTDEGRYVREHDATIVQASAPRGFELADGEKWIDISIFHGTLVAYEGDRAVFATLISPGANGYKRENGSPAKYTTPTGTFRIEWKHLSTTMTPDPERMSYYLAEVPYTQFFHMPFALHAAYWHDRFGEPKSGGCVNLSPTDAKWLFGWTSPALPAGWHGVRAGDARGMGTWVRVH